MYFILLGLVITSFVLELSNDKINKDFKNSKEFFLLNEMKALLKKSAIVPLTQNYRINSSINNSQIFVPLNKTNYYFYVDDKIYLSINEENNTYVKGYDCTEPEECKLIS